MRRFRFLAVAVVAALGVLGPAASASAADSFDGVCNVSGTATFTNPGGALPAANGFVFDGTGTCDGSLNGGPSQTYEIHAVVGNDNATLGCIGSASLDGPGGIQFLGTNGPEPDDDVVIEGNLDQLSVGTEVPFKLDGAEGGFALGRASFLSAGPAAVPDCAAGTVKSLAFDATFLSIPGMPVSG